MALSMFPGEMIGAARAVIIAADAARAFRDGIGDADWSELDAIQNGLRGAKIGCLRAIAEAQKAPAAAETYMASMGGPVTLAAFIAAMTDIEVKAAAWNGALATWLGAISATELVSLDVDQASATRFINRRLPILGSTVASLRASSELDALILALEAVGA